MDKQQKEILKQNKIQDSDEILLNNSSNLESINQLQIGNSQENLLSKQILNKDNQIQNQSDIKANEYFAHQLQAIREEKSNCMQQQTQDKIKSGEIIQNNNSIELQKIIQEEKNIPNSCNLKLNIIDKSDLSKEFEKKQLESKQPNKQCKNQKPYKKIKIENQSHEISQQNKLQDKNIKLNQDNNNDQDECISDQNDYSNHTESSNDNDDYDADDDNNNEEFSQQQNVNAFVTKTYGDYLSENEADDEIAQYIQLAKDNLAKKSKMSQQKAEKMKKKIPQIILLCAQKTI